LQYVDLNVAGDDSAVAAAAADARVRQFYGVLSSSLDCIRCFCDRVPGIGELSQTDRELLFQSACLELFVLRLAYR
jgi:nuclear receptor subfamily 4 group A protein 2